MLYEVITELSDFEVKDKGASLFPYILEDGSFRIHRITSYNVCYTKLLRQGNRARSCRLGRDSHRAGIDAKHSVLGACQPGTVITSYSIHYTKLYDRSEEAVRDGRRLAGRGFRALRRRLVVRRDGLPVSCRQCVITSYSIHYTKLYDQYTVPGPEAFPVITRE